MRNRQHLKKGNTEKILRNINSARGIINLAGGTPLFLVNEYLNKNNYNKLFNRKNFEYPADTHGLIDLRMGIAEQLSVELGYDVSPHNILITAGSTAALYAVFKTLVKKNDEVIVFSPHWSLYGKQIELIGAKLVEVPLDEKDGWDINFDILKKTISEKTKCLVLTNPTSPMGSIIPQSSIIKLLTLLKFHNINLIVDETYRHIIYDNTPFVSPSRYKQFRGRIIVIRSFSKDLSISGLRLGYLYCSPELLEEISSVHLSMNLTSPVLSQAVALELLKWKNEIDIKIKSEYSIRCNAVTSFLNKWNSFLNYVKPSAGFFVFPKYELTITSLELFKILLSEYKVAIRPGSEFGKGGEHHVRISFSYPINYIQSGLARISKFINTYKK